jgi:hypothetical protein
MKPLCAIVKNGRLVLDEPTDLPEGQVVVLLPLEELLGLADPFGVSDTETTSLVVPPRPAFKESKPVDAASLLEELRAM